ncbi:MAG: vitamin B12-dependent ribonucleotide reductase [Deltaproteobacteria bacterium]|nr:vitamin B12-dependent ribonucleotide reductase [Deltaproteobacteria bacterium]
MSAKGRKKEAEDDAEERSAGLLIKRFYTREGSDPLSAIRYELRDSVIQNTDGSIVFEMKNAEVPSDWSQLASDIAISKYLRKAGVNGDPSRGERSVRDLVYRVSHTIRESGERLGGYFATSDDAEIFELELREILVRQRAAFNSPVWFNCGLFQRYGIAGSGGNWACDPETGAIVQTKDAYQNPQCSACFIQKIEDDLMSIYNLVKNEARLFKYGSGTGTNFSPIRGHQERLSGGGTSSGLMSFLEVLDRAAGATKSGGTTRRAAKMVCLDMDHPEIVDFIQWKMKEENKAKALVSAGYSSDFNGEAYHTVSGQNSNNSVRVTDAFMRAVQNDGEWRTYFRTTNQVSSTYKARDLWQMIIESAWACADPGLQFDTTINDWHTCHNTGRINASNPCSEYMFLDDSACNLASINLVKYLDNDGRFDVEAFRYTVRLMILAQEILVDYSSYPTESIARNSHDFRPLGLGYANLGTVLMRLGIPYDSAQARALCAAITAIMCGEAYRTSAEIAASKGAFEGFEKNRQPMLHVMNKHRQALSRIEEAAGYLPNSNEPRIDESIIEAAKKSWDEAIDLGNRYGYRNAQATVLAPTGTIGLLMDCDTTGIEPDFALVKFKKLAGGGYFKIVNQSVPAALRRLGYSDAQVADIVSYITGTNTFTAAPHASRKWLLEKGLTKQEIENAEALLPLVFDAAQALAPRVIGKKAYQRLEISADEYENPKFNLLRWFGLDPQQVDEVNDHVIGRMTIEGAPHIRRDHLAVFDCANRCGKRGKRYLSPMAHVHMMAAAQPFLSGAISKTVNLPNSATLEDISEIYMKSWELGLKAVAIYRDGCKSSQPLSTSDDRDSKSNTMSESENNEKKEAAQATSRSSIPASFVEGATPPPTIRHRLPRKRTGFTQEARVAGHKVFLRTGEYGDGSLGEIFIDMHKEGAAFRSLMNCFAISVSMGLQHGVPLESYVNQFTFTRFEPQGPVEGHPNIRFATSIIDYVFRVLGIEYLKRYELAHKPPEEVQAEISKPTDVSAAKQAEHDMQRDAYLKPRPSAPERQIELFESNEPISSSLDQQLSELMGDAPICDQCGHITVRNGSCYKCLNCGNSMGCS